MLGEDITPRGFRISSSLTLAHTDRMKTSDSGRVILKNPDGKAVIDTRIIGDVERRYTRTPAGKALQIVFERGHIVHIHCKDSHCGNEWKIEKSREWNPNFMVTQIQDGPLRITCKKCGRIYQSG